jgi:hypothetical protein
MENTDSQSKIYIAQVMSDLEVLYQQQTDLVMQLEAVRKNIAGLNSVVDVWNQCSASDAYFNYVSAVVEGFKEIKNAPVSE